MKSAGSVIKLLVVVFILGFAGTSLRTPSQASPTRFGEFCPDIPPDPSLGPRYTIVDLGTLGGTGSNAHDINNFGQIVGEAYTSGGDSHAYIWQNNSMLDLGALTSDSIAYAINDSTDIVGYSDGQAVRWTGLPGSITGLGFLPGGAYSTAEGVNSVGKIVGSADTTNVIPFGKRAFKYVGGVMTDIGTLPGGSWSFAHDINLWGEVVGNSTVDVGGGYGGPHATLWSFGTIQDLSVLAGQAPPHRFSMATAINNRTEIVGDSWENLSGLYKEPFYWNEKSGMKELLPGFDTNCPYGNAFDINNFGQAVGIAGDASFRTPVLWQDGKMYILYDQIMDPGDWLLLEAHAINDAGMIVGLGVIGGQGHGFLLLPEVATELTAEHLEVTQAIQDLHNSVRLVADKRTFVRFYVSATGKDVWTFARLKVEKNGATRYLAPINPGAHIIVRTGDPLLDRNLLNSSFLFELPSGFRDGSVTLTAEVNPETSWRGRTPQETNYADNTLSLTVPFEVVPPLPLTIFSYGYATEYNTPYLYPLPSELWALQNWLERAYPISELSLGFRELTLFKPAVPEVGFDCEDVNDSMLYYRAWAGWTTTRRIYAMVSDDGGFMQGCANAIPGLVASGPAGRPEDYPDFAWDTDFTYGDWYGGHEIAHTLGRYHAEFCDATDGDPNYPYSFGNISNAYEGMDAFFGFDIQAPHRIYHPGWKDVMTYCEYVWISDYTYEWLMTYIQGSFSNNITQPSSPTDRLLVLGKIDPAGQVDLKPLFVIPDAEDVDPNTPGPYALVLRDGAGNELVRYPFTPDTPSDEEGTLGISEFVPYMGGMEQLDVEGPGGDLLTSITAGAAPPTVTLLESHQNELSSPSAVTVNWIASDPDDDPLSFAVQYSPDNGLTWEIVTPYVTTTTVVISDTNLIAGDLALFRVWATDGIHTVNDTTDNPFTIPNHPPTAEILEPSSWMTITVSQTLGLVGQAYDIDLGTMDDSQLTWLSDLEGTLGNGPQLSVTGLITGLHTITFQANDGTDSVTDTVKVLVVSNPTQLPYPENTLLAAPSPMTFYSTGSIMTQTLSIANQNIFHALSWDAVADQPWLSLSLDTGATPASLTVTFDPADLPPGDYQGTITLTSLELPGYTLEINVRIHLNPYQVYLPMIQH